ncbi:TetR/AcrR family transcriptional regulator [Parachitinimonas caeni]|uniref:TetR/AcrR family transcriptional regulator n=1 Tax=Parachitinimonas caeni TaxID=3031301 RepID=A0ABT7E3I4_9NEIS|nr:TetR/AcrR family transcriptional regulator [Parachitinimonas caeni]MDK2126609.1 TetR/AcrR family transcriptional regulator [Parachitinimonas caeni]
MDHRQLHQKALDGLRLAAGKKPLTDVNYGDIAAEAGLPWQTVRRLLGGRERFGEWLNPESVDHAPTPSDSRSRILDSAAKVFARKGYQGASLDEVAADAGMTKGAVYWNFSSKSELFFALLDARFMREVNEHMPRAVESNAANPDRKAALTDMLLDMVARLEQDPDWPRLFIEFMGETRAPEVRERLADMYEHSYRMTVAMIEQINAHAGLPPVGERAQAMAVFWGALIDGLVLAWIVNPQRIHLRSLIPQIVDMLWQGLSPDAEQAPAGLASSPDRLHS